MTTTDKTAKAEKSQKDQAKEDDARLVTELASWRKNLQAQGVDIFAVLNFIAKSAFGVTAQPDPPEDAPQDQGGEKVLEAGDSTTKGGDIGADTIDGGQGADSDTGSGRHTWRDKGKT